LEELHPTYDVNPRATAVAILFMWRVRGQSFDVPLEELVTIESLPRRLADLTNPEQEEELLGRVKDYTLTLIPRVHPGPDGAVGVRIAIPQEGLEGGGTITKPTLMQMHTVWLLDRGDVTGDWRVHRID
jgi:hypothetical protein